MKRRQLHALCLVLRGIFWAIPRLSRPRARLRSSARLELQRVPPWSDLSGFTFDLIDGDVQGTVASNGNFRAINFGIGASLGTCNASRPTVIIGGYYFPYTTILLNGPPG